MIFINTYRNILEACVNPTKWVLQGFAFGFARVEMVQKMHLLTAEASSPYPEAGLDNNSPGEWQSRRRWQTIRDDAGDGFRVRCRNLLSNNIYNMSMLGGCSIPRGLKENCASIMEPSHRRLHATAFTGHQHERSSRGIFSASPEL